MKLIIPGTDSDMVKNLLIKSMLEIADKTGYFGYVTDDDGRLIKGMV